MVRRSLAGRGELGFGKSRMRKSCQKRVLRMGVPVGWVCFGVAGTTRGGGGTNKAVLGSNGTQ